MSISPREDMSVSLMNIRYNRGSFSHDGIICIVMIWVRKAVLGQREDGCDV